NNCTISESGASGIVFELGSLTMVNTIMNANFANGTSEAGPALGTASFSLVRSFTAGNRSIADGGNNLVLTSAQMLLSAPGNYGGNVNTIGLLVGSPAIDTGTNAGAPATDARGVTRPQ